MKRLTTLFLSLLALLWTGPAAAQVPESQPATAVMLVPAAASMPSTDSGASRETRTAIPVALLTFLIALGQWWPKVQAKIDGIDPDAAWLPAVVKKALKYKLIVFGVITAIVTGGQMLTTGATWWTVAFNTLLPVVTLLFPSPAVEPPAVLPQPTVDTQPSAPDATA